MITHSFYVYVNICFLCLAYNQKLLSKRTANTEKEKKKGDLKSQPKHYADVVFNKQGL